MGSLNQDGSRKTTVNKMGRNNGGRTGISLPNGLTADTTAMPDESRTPCGYGSIVDSNTTNYGPLVNRWVNSVSQIVPITASTSSAGQMVQVNSTSPITFGSGDEVYIEASVPIL